MADLPSIAKRIQIEETRTETPVSESTAQKLGGTMNWILDHYTIPEGVMVDCFLDEADVQPGWDIPDGRERPRTGNWANLYAKIGRFCGIGDGVTTWNLPDVRGCTTRMQDDTSIGAGGRDPDKASRTPFPGGAGLATEPNSYQADGFASHTHRVGQQAGGSGGPTWQSSGDSPNNQQSGPAGGSETRMKNILVLKIIKL
jgi:microcystin-dependent protein